LFCSAAAEAQHYDQQQRSTPGGGTTSGGTTSGGGTTGGGGGSTGGSLLPAFTHAFIVLEENHSYSNVIGSSSMPYLNGLASANGLATQYYADAHPSLPNYFMLTVGAGTSITGSEGDSYSGVVTQDNVVQAITAAGKTWKCYAESLPSVGYLGTDSGAYVQHHNPFVYFSDVQSSSTQASNVVPLLNWLPTWQITVCPIMRLSFPTSTMTLIIVPSAWPTCTSDQMLATADQWLSTNISPLLASWLSKIRC